MDPKGRSPWITTVHNWKKQREREEKEEEAEEEREGREGSGGRNK